MSGGIDSRATSAAFSRPPARPVEQADDRAHHDRQAPVLPRHAEEHGREAHHRADRQVDAAGDDHRRQRNRQQPELDAEPADLHEVARPSRSSARSRQTARSPRRRRSSRIELVGPQEALHDAAPAAALPQRRPGAQRVGRDRGEDDDAVQRALPVRGDAEERERRPDGAEQHHAEQRPAHRSPAAGDGGAADDDRGDDLELEAEPGVARNLVEPHRIQQRGQADERARDREHRRRHGLDANAGEPGGLRRSSRSRRSPVRRATGAAPSRMPPAGRSPRARTSHGYTDALVPSH